MKDKLATAWKAIQKYHFWILTVLVLIVGMFAWMNATAEMAEQFETRKQKLSNDIKSVRTIAGEHNPPNQKVVGAIEAEHNELKENVLKAWEILYREQKAKNPWPGVLGEEFLAMIEAIGPADEIPVRFRDTYLYFIRDHFPQLFKLIDIRRPKVDETSAEGEEARMAGATGRMRNEDVEMTGKVEWDMADRQRILDRFDWQTRPATIQIRLAQEDLWVYEALLRIIKNTNEGATSFYNAAVKRIDTLLIGQDAAEMLKKPKDPFAKAPGQTGAAGGEMGMGMDMEMGMEGGMMEGEAMMMEGGRAGAQTEESIEADLLDGRYVNDQGIPLPYGAKHPFAEFKMMPIQMDLVMDQRRIPELLVECANSSMPVEVRQVGINPGEAGKIDFNRMGSGPRSSSSRRRSSGNMQMGEMEYMGMSGGMDYPGSDELVMGDFDVTVRIQGVIYIYNPPDRDKLGTGAGVEQTGEQPAPATPGEPAQPAVPATQPAEPTAPAAPADAPTEPTAPAASADAPTEPTAPAAPAAAPTEPAAPPNPPAETPP